MAEVELDPGEYHVTSYTCLSPRNGLVRVASSMQLSGKVESLASFTIAAGEIVNTGFLVIEPVRVVGGGGIAVLGWRISVRDWPIEEINRFKTQRPQLYAAMQARLMTVTKVPPVTAEQVAVACEPHKKLQAEGKIQELPPLCRPGAKLPGELPRSARRRRPAPSRRRRPLTPERCSAGWPRRSSWAAIRSKP